MSLSIREIARANVIRMLRWHGEDNWSPEDWAVAFAGEAGEVCNAVKKLRRVEDGFANRNDPGRQLDTREAAVLAIGEEMADALLCMLLLANKLGIDLEAEVVAKFNATSARYGFPDRLPLPSPEPETAEARRLKALIDRVIPFIGYEADVTDLRDECYAAIGTATDRRSPEGLVE